MKKIYALALFVLFIGYNLYLSGSHYLFHGEVRWDQFNYLGWVSVVLGIFCFCLATANHKVKLHFSTVAFVIIPAYTVYKMASTYALFFDVYPLSQHLLMWLGIVVYVSVFGIYLYFKSFVGEYRPVWYFISPRYFVQSAKGSERVLLTVFLLGPLLYILFVFVVYKPLRSILYEYDIGIYYTYIMVLCATLFVGYWLFSIYRSLRS